MSKVSKTELAFAVKYYNDNESNGKVVAESTPEYKVFKRVSTKIKAEEGFRNWYAVNDYLEAQGGESDEDVMSAYMSTVER